MNRKLYAMLILSLALAISASAQCVNGTGLTGFLVAGTANVPIGTSIQAITESGECAGETVYEGKPFALALWGDYDLTEGGFQEGEEIAYVATEEGLRDVSYRLYPFGLGYDDMGSGMFYAGDALTEAQALVPAPGDTATAVWTDGQVNPTDTVWTTTLRVDSPVPLGAVLIELKLLNMPGDTLRPKVHLIAPAADTLVQGDTLAAVYIGAGASSVSWTISGTGSGALDLYRIRATDRTGDKIHVRTTETLAVIHPYIPAIAGDVNDDGTVDTQDVRDFFVALVNDSALERADLWPWPEGDGLINLGDFYILNAAVHTGQYPGGEALP